MIVAQRLGIIDTLSLGFSIVHRGLWLLLIPVLLDLLFWLGPGISFAPVLEQAVAKYHQLLTQSAAQLAPPYRPSEEETGQLLTLSQQWADSMKGGNLLGLLAWRLPSLTIAATNSFLPRLSDPEKAATVVHFSRFLVLVLALGLLGLVGTSLYLGGLARLVLGDAWATAPFLEGVGRNSVRLVAYFLLLALVGVPSALLALAVVGVAGFWSGALSALLSTLSLTAIFAAVLYLFFAEEAIFLGDVGPVRAIWSSANVVWRNFWSAILLMLLINVITLGTPLALRLIWDHPLGRLAAIGGHAYIATGLAAAAMVYYRQRSLLWQESIAAKDASALKK